MGAADSFHYIVSVPPGLYGNLFETPNQAAKPSSPKCNLVFLFCFIWFFILFCFAFVKKCSNLSHGAADTLAQNEEGIYCTENNLKRLYFQFEASECIMHIANKS